MIPKGAAIGLGRAGRTVFLAMLLLLPSACSEQADLHQGRHPLAEESYVLIQVDDPSELDRLTRMMSIDKVRGGQVWAYLPGQRLNMLRELGYAWEELPHPGVNPGARMGLFGPDGHKRWDHFPTYSEYVDVLHQFADEYPHLCRLHDFGDGTNQANPHDLWVMKISDNPGEEEDEPEVFYNASMHGDETVGYVLMLHLIDELLTNYGAGDEITGLVDNLELWINPLANPDGTYYGGDHTVGSAIRNYTTSSGAYSYTDANRNYPDVVQGDHPDGNAWWNETEAVMDFVSSRSFVHVANFHGGAEVVIWPWFCRYARHSDNDWYHQLSREYADNCQADGWSGYMTQHDDGVTNGYAWFTIYGTQMDYMNYWHGLRETIVEISSTKNPSASTLDDYWQANRQALLDYMKHALTGIRGTVTDNFGQPLAADVELLNYDDPNDMSEIHTDPAAGNYHRMLLPGTYDMRFNSEGYLPQDVPGVEVTDGDASRVDVVMYTGAKTNIFGQVISLSNQMPVPGATIEVVDWDIEPATSSRSGYYSLPVVDEGAYLIRVSCPGYETLEEKRVVTIDSPRHDFEFFRILEEYATDLEADNGGLVASGEPAPGWEWGVASGPAHSGQRTWGTLLAGDYANQASWHLDLPGISVPKLEPVLTFWHWYAAEAGHDGGNLKISTDGGQTFSLLFPEGDYPADLLDALGEPGFTGTSGSWLLALFDLSAYSGKNVTLRFEFGSDGSKVSEGWYLDDLSIHARLIQ
jgi:hypothetical protein